MFLPVTAITVCNVTTYIVPFHQVIKAGRRAGADVFCPLPRQESRSPHAKYSANLDYLNQSSARFYQEPSHQYPWIRTSCLFSTCQDDHPTPRTRLAWPATSSALGCRQVLICASQKSRLTPNRLSGCTFSVRTRAKACQEQDLTSHFLCTILDTNGDLDIHTTPETLLLKAEAV